MIPPAPPPNLSLEDIQYLLRCHQTKMGISLGHLTLKFWQSPHFQNREFERGKFFSPECRLKAVKFAKNERLDALIVLARDEQFLFFP